MLIYSRSTLVKFIRTAKVAEWLVPLSLMGTSITRLFSQPCIFCHKKSNFSCFSNYITGFCVRCYSCSNSFHITCGYREGVTFEINEDSTSVKAICKRCKSKMNKCQIRRNLDDVKMNSEVIAKYGSFYAVGRVICQSEELFHRVQFVDNTQVDDITSCDILVSPSVIAIVKRVVLDNLFFSILLNLNCLNKYKIMFN